MTAVSISSTSVRTLKLVLVFLLAGIGVQAQTTTRADGTEEKTEGNEGKTNILIIPWNPKLFNAEADVTRSLAKESGQTYNQMQYAFSKGMIDQIKKQFGASYNVTSLLDDTAKMKRDLADVYDLSGGEWTGVNTALNPVAKTPEQKKKEAAQKQVSKGQIQTQEAEGEKFMNAVVFSPNLLSFLKKKYNADYVIFLNQFDLVNDFGDDPYNLQQRTDYKRKAVLHWTIFATATSKRVAMGKSSGSVANTSNNPKKIIEAVGPTIGKAILQKYTAAPKQ
ncbi:MAG: hypothetical protein ACRCYO_04530 [Bacteroidia bacterium]